MLIQPKNWREFQHYKHRLPPWIRLHKSLLDDYEFHCLPTASRALAPMLWLLASESIDGVIDANVGKLSFRLHLPEKEIEKALKHLIDKGFFTVASNTLAECLHNADSETETETETLQSRGTAVAVLHTKGTRWSSSAVVPDAWKQEALDKRASSSLSVIDIDLTAEQFANYWSSRADRGAVKLDWKKTWMNWVTTQKAHAHGPRTTGSAHTNFAIGALEAAREFTRSRSGGGTV